nr:PREDICTED: DNA-binding protein RFX7-like [Paralichthys olivaceus]
MSSCFISPEVKTPQSVSAFIPTAEAHSFQPHGTNLSSPSVDAKQQLQRKIQRKQQEQKLHSPSPGEGQTRRADDSVPSGSPPPPSPQPTIGIVVAAVPSPITVQRSRQLMSPSPVGTVESKVLPFNFQMVTQPMKQSPKTLQNILPNPAGERTARQRYAQILPKPLATTPITLHSPSAMIIANSPIKTVMTTCHVSPVSLVKMTTISLAPNSGNTTTTLTNATLRSASAGISTFAVAEDISSNETTRSASAVPLLAPVAWPGQTAAAHCIDVEMEVEAIHQNSQMQNPSSLILTQGAMANRSGGAVQRAASVPIPQTKGFLVLDETSINKCNGNSSSCTYATAEVESSNSSANNTSILRSTPSPQNTSTVSILNTSRAPSCGGSCGVTPTKESFLSTKSLRKRSSLSPELSPVKRIFMPQQPVGGVAALGYGIRKPVSYVSRLGAPTRPESAPATREVEVKMNSVSATQVHSLCTSSFRPSGFYSVAKTQSTIQRKNTSTVLENSSSVSHALTQQQQGHTVANMHVIPNNQSLQQHSGDGRISNPTTGILEGAQQQSYTQSNPTTETLEFLSQTSSNHLPMQTDMDYFNFDDDVTQDSIVEELVQMEEQMKLNSLRGFGVTMQGKQSVMPDNVMSANQTMTAFYHGANNSGNLIHTPTPTPTPTPTSEMMGTAQGFSGESPCSRMASTTPVDSALGSSRHTPLGTPHSSCSSTVPPSPVECRNPFAFTPINSSITGFHDCSTISSSPVKPMQRPMATHPDKTRLEWMNNSYNSSSESLNKSNSGMRILPGYQGLIDDHFQKPHAFAVPHARYHDSSFGRLTPISPVQQQVTNMANMTKQEGFAVPAPLDNKTSNVTATNFRCRSVSPAVHQRNFCGNTGNSTHPNVLRSVASPFNSPVAPEMLNIFANSQTNLGVSSMAQRSRSVPLNIMMQTEVRPTAGQQCNNKNIGNVLLSKLDSDHDDALRGLGISHLSSSYTARMNLTQILESDPSLSCAENQLSMMTSDATCKLQRPDYLIENTINEPMHFSTNKSRVQSASGEHQQAQIMLTLNQQQQREELQQHQQLDFSSTVKDLLTDHSLAAGSQLVEQVSELTTGGADFPCEIRMTSEFSSSINDLNALDPNLLFDPNQQQGQYQNAAPEELVNDPLFQHITSDTAHSSGLDWLESKDQTTVGLMG